MRQIGKVNTHQIKIKPYSSTVKEYAIANIVQPKSIKYISMISNGRVCLYFSNKTTVTNPTMKCKSIPINNETEISSITNNPNSIFEDYSRKSQYPTVFEDNIFKSRNI